MPVRYRIDARLRRVICEVFGEVTRDDILETVRDVTEDPEFRPGFDIYSDHSEVGDPITSADVTALVNRLRAASSVMAGVRWAIVAPQPASFGTMRMLAAHAEEVPMDVRVFRTTEEAEAWLDGDGDVFRER